MKNSEWLGLSILAGVWETSIATHWAAAFCGGLSVLFFFCFLWTRDGGKDDG